jgi:hypothetical protein
VARIGIILMKNSYRRGKTTLLGRKCTVLDETWSVFRQSLLHYNEWVACYVKWFTLPHMAPPGGHHGHHFSQILLSQRGKTTLLGEICIVLDNTWAAYRELPLLYPECVKCHGRGFIVPQMAPPCGHQGHHLSQILLFKRGKIALLREICIVLDKTWVTSALPRVCYMP